MSGTTVRRRIEEISSNVDHRNIFDAQLAEAYDGIGQYVQVSLSRGSTSPVHRARISAGDSGSGKTFPVSTPVTVYISHGHIEVLSLGGTRLLNDAEFERLGIEPTTDLTGAGANLVKNSSFENSDVSAWAVGTSWVFGYVPINPQKSFSLNKTARVTTTGTSSGLLSHGNIVVDRDDDYWFSAWVFVRSYTAGILQFLVEEYDASGSLLATTTIEVQAVDLKWTRYSLRFGSDDSLDRIAFQTNTDNVRVVFRAINTPTLVADIDGVQVERGKLLTAYAPAPQELIDLQVGTTQIADDAITSPKIITNAVVAGKIAANAITAVKIDANAVTTDKLNASAVTADKIATNAVTADKIIANAVTAGKIAANAVAANEIAANAVVAGKIAANAVASNEIAANSIVTGKIASGVSTTGMLIISTGSGAPVIIDGTSVVFKIAVSGTLASGGGPGNGATVELSTIYATGLTSAPMHTGSAGFAWGLLPYSIMNPASGAFNDLIQQHTNVINGNQTQVWVRWMTTEDRTGFAWSVKHFIFKEASF